jgi:hypothetical protein
MNYTLRNFPPPFEITIHSDCGISARTKIVMDICNKINELNEFYFGLEAQPVLVPSQANCDERMPLTYLRPCIIVLNSIIIDTGFNVEHVPELGYNMDYHAFVPVCRNISQTINKIIGELGGKDG